MTIFFIINVFESNHIFKNTDYVDQENKFLVNMFCSKEISKILDRRF